MPTYIYHISNKVFEKNATVLLLFRINYSEPLRKINNSVKGCNKVKVL